MDILVSEEGTKAMLRNFYYMARKEISEENLTKLAKCFIRTSCERIISNEEDN